jgi:hypothetical protein
MKRTFSLIAGICLVALMVVGCGLLETKNGTIVIENNTTEDDNMTIRDVKVGENLEEGLNIAAGQSYTVSVAPDDYNVRVWAGSTQRYIDVTVKSDATVKLSYERNTAVSADFHLVKQ